MDVSRILWRPRIQNSLFTLAIGLMLLALIGFPTQSVAAAREGVDLCLNVILPSLFPFFVLSTLCVELGLIQGLGRLLEKLMMPLFRVNGSCAGAFLLGIVGGYPVGARTAISLYEKGQCTKTEAERLLSFCNNSGPAFILGVVGAGIFSSGTAGLWLYGAHVCASILVGLLFRFYGKDERPTGRQVSASASVPGFPEAFTGAVKSAFQSTLNICGFVIFFTVFIRLLFLTGVITALAKALAWLLQGFGMQQAMAESLISGAIEMTSGVWSLRDMAASLGSRLCLAAFILGWAGLSVHCQVLSFIGSSGLSTKTYFFGKLLHGLFSAGLIFLVSKMLGWDAPVSTYLAGQVSTIAQLRFRDALTVSTLSAGAVWLILTVLSVGLLIRQRNQGTFCKVSQKSR
jgi:sporulation integral membrane protein YlbJ